MGFFRSFRFRIAGLAVLLSSLVLAFVGVSAWTLTRRLGLDALDQQLLEEIRRHNNESRRPGHWDRFERQFQNMPAEDRARIFTAVVARDRIDGKLTFQSSLWPRSLSIGQIPDPPMPPAAPRQQQPLREGGLENQAGFPRGPGVSGFGPPGDPMRPLQGRPEAVPLGPPPPIAFSACSTWPTKSGNYRVAVGGTDRITFMVAADLRPLEKNLSQLSRAMAAAAIPGLLLIAAMGGFLAARALRPVARLTSTAERITARGLGERLPATPESEEFQRLTGVFNAMLDRLEKSFHQATRFSGDAAHELKTPLTILQGRIEQSLSEAADGSEHQRLCAELLEETQRLKGIVRKLLLLSLADAGQLKLQKDALDFSRMAEDAADDARVLAPELRIETEIASDVRVAGDEDLLGQVLQNLVGNAIKYNQSGGFVRLVLARDSAAVKLSVANSGTPIGAEYRERIFERFFRADASRSRTVEGVGLGLSLAREIARAHGGELVLERSDEAGTVFALTLPA